MRWPACVCVCVRVRVIHVGSLQVVRLPPTVQRHAHEANWQRRCECEWLFVSQCWPSHELATCPGCNQPSQ